MALSMEERRILAEIEQHLTRDEPALAARLARFEHPHPGMAGVLGTPRGRLLASLAALATLVLMSMLVYLLLSLRGIPQRGFGGRPTAAANQHGLIASRPSTYGERPATAAKPAQRTPAGSARTAPGRHAPGRGASRGASRR